MGVKGEKEKRPKGPSLAEPAFEIYKGGVSFVGSKQIKPSQDRQGTDQDHERNTSAGENDRSSQGVLRHSSTDLWSEGTRQEALQN